MKATILFDNGEVNFNHLDYLTKEEVYTLFESIQMVETIQEKAHERRKQNDNKKE